MSEFSRRNLLVSATATAALIGAFVPEAADAVQLPPPATTPTLGAADGKGGFEAVSVVYYATDVRQLGDYTPRSIDARFTNVADLRGTAGGPIVGVLHSTGTVLALPQRGDNSHASLETHLLTFDDGQSSVTGTGLRRHDGSGVFTITGGSGRFSGTTGSYTAVLHPNTGGRGTGTITATFK